MTESKSNNDKKLGQTPIRHEEQQEEKKQEREQFDREHAEYELKLIRVTAKRAALGMAACSAGKMLHETHPVVGWGVTLSVFIAYIAAAYNDDLAAMKEPELVPGFQNLWNRWSNNGDSAPETGSVE